MIGLFLKDILPQKVIYPLVFGASFVLFPATSHFLDVPTIPVNIGPPMILFALSFLLGIGSFMTDEKDHVETTICSMPISRTQIVGARYLLTILLYAALNAVGFVSEWVVNAALGESGFGYMWAYFGGTALSLTLLFIAYPAYYALGNTNGQRVMFVAFFAFAFFVPNVAGRIAGRTLPPFLEFLRTPYLAALLVCGVVGAIGVASLLLSIMWYRRREF